MYDGRFRPKKHWGKRKSRKRGRQRGHSVIDPSVRPLIVYRDRKQKREEDAKKRPEPIIQNRYDPVYD